MRLLTPAQARAEALSDSTKTTSTIEAPANVTPAASGMRIITDPQEQMRADTRRRIVNPVPNWYDEYRVNKAAFQPGGEITQDKEFWGSLWKEASTLLGSGSVADLKEVDNAFYAGFGSTLTSGADFTMTMISQAARKIGADTVADAAHLGSTWARAGTHHFESYAPQDPGLWSKLAMGSGSVAAMVLPALLTGGMSSAGGIGGLAVRLGAAGRGAGAVGALMKFGAHSVGKAAVAGYIEASAEAGGVMAEALVRGDTEEEAFEKGAKILLPVMAQSMASHWIGFSKYSRLVRAGGEGLTNAIEEMNTGHLGDWALGDKEFTDVDDFAIEYFEDGFLGVVLGGAVGAALPSQKKLDTPPAEKEGGPKLKAPKRESTPKAPAGSELQAEMVQYAQDVQAEARELNVEDLKDVVVGFVERHANGDKLSTEETIQWVTAQDEVWRREVAQNLQQFDDIDLIRAVDHTLDSTTPTSIGRDGRTMLGAAMDELDNRGIASKETIERFKAWEGGTNPRASDMSRVEGAESANTGAVTVEVAQNNKFFPADGFTATITQPDGSTVETQFPTKEAAESFKTDRERIGKVEPGETSREGRKEGPRTEPLGLNFSINIDQNNPYFPMDGFTVRVVDLAGTEQSYHFDTREQAEAFAHKKYDALADFSVAAPEMNRMVADVEGGKPRASTVEDLLAEAEKKDAESGKSNKGAMHAALFLRENRELVVRKMQELGQAQGDSGGGAATLGELFAKLGDLVNQARVEVIREHLGDVVADDFQRVLDSRAKKEAERAKVKEDADKKKTQKKDEKAVDKLVETLDEEIAKDDKAAVADLVAEEQKKGKETEAARKQAAADKAAVDDLVTKADEDAGKTQAGTELSTKQVREKLEAEGLKFGKFKLTGPKPVRRLKGRNRSQVYDAAAVQSFIDKQLGREPGIEATTPPPQDEAFENVETPDTKVGDEPVRVAEETAKASKERGLKEPDKIDFEVSTRAQKNQIDTVAQVDEKLAEDLLAKRPVARHRLDAALRDLHALANNIMDDWIRHVEIHGIPKNNIGQPQLVPPEVEAIQRAQAQIEKQLKNLDENRPAWDPGARPLPNIIPALNNPPVSGRLHRDLPEVFKKVTNNDVLTKEEHAQVRKVLSALVAERDADARKVSSKFRLAALQRVDEIKTAFNIIKSQSAAVNFNAQRAARLEREAKKRKGGGDVTLGVGFGALQPTFESLVENVKSFLNSVLNRGVSAPWSKGMKQLVTKHAIGREKMTVGEKYRAIVENFTMKMVDDYKFAKDAIEEGGKGIYFRGRELSTVHDMLAIGLSPYHTLRGLVRSSSAVAEAALEHGVRTFITGKHKLSKLSHAEVLRKYPSIHENYEEFGVYLRSRMVMEWAVARPEDFRDAAAVQGLAYAKKAVSEAHGRGLTEWNTATAELTDISNGLLRYAQQAGVLTAQDVQDISSKYGLYVPMWEAAEDTRISTKAKGAKAPRPTKVFRKYTPGAVTMHPAEALGLNHHTVMASVHSNFARGQLAKIIRLGDAQGMTSFGQILDPKAQRKSIFVKGSDAFGAVRKDLRARVQEKMKEARFPKAAQRLVMKELQNNKITDEQVKLWVLDADLGDGVVAFLEDGELKLMKVDPAIADVFVAASKSQADFLVRVASTFAGLTRTGITLTPEFGLVNPLRDVITSMFIGRKVIKNPKGMAEFMVRWWASLFDVAKHRPAYQTMLSTGGGIAGFHAMDLPELSSRTKAMIETGKKQGKFVFVFKHPIEALRVLSGLTENATRLTTHKMTLEDLQQSGNYSDEAAHFIAGMAARENSVDFQKAGVYGRVINSFIPFFNAELGGASVMIDSMRNDPKGFVQWGGMMVALPTLLLWAWNNSDDERRDRWEKEPDWVKHNYWVFYPNESTKFLLPKPFEVGAIFGSMTEKIADAMMQQDPKEMGKFANHFIATNVPMNFGDFVTSAHLLGPLGASIGQVEANYDPFRQAPIVSTRLGRQRPPHQYSENTSALAIWLGRRLDEISGGETSFSPIKADYLVRANLGSGPKSLHDAVNWAVRKATGQTDEVARPEWYFRAPGMRRFLRREPGSYDAKMEEFFDLYEAAEAATNSYNRLVMSGDLPAVAREMGLVGDVIYLHGILKDAADQIAETTRYIEMAKVSTTYTPEQKRDEIDNLRRYRSSLAAQQLEVLDLKAAADAAKQASETLGRIE